MVADGCRAAASALLVAAALTLPLPATAIEWDLAGYGRTWNGLQLHDIDAPDALIEAAGIAERAAIGSSIARLEWGFEPSNTLRIDLHQRLAWFAATPADATANAGSGITPAPTRSLDLRSTWIDEEGFSLEHDLDRAVLRIFTDEADIAIGRQAIAWGTSLLFPVADLWAGFSPYDLDTSQKRGIDALRLLSSFGPRAEIDLVLADRGSWRDLSAAGRLTLFLDRGDLYLAAGKFFDRFSLLHGVTATRGDFKARAELALPADPSPSLPRATLGLDWFAGPELLCSIEAHHNGDGTAEGPVEYMRHALSSAPLARGETYLLARWYAGTLISWRSPLWGANASIMANLTDPSALATWSISHEPVQGVTLSAGAFHGLGPDLQFAPEPEVRSEYGSYGHLLYFEMAAYF